MDQRMTIDEAAKAASKVLPSNPDYSRYLQGLLARLSPEDRSHLAEEGLTTLATRLSRHRARNARSRDTRSWSSAAGTDRIGEPRP
jgi:hypothetical protein